MLAMSSTEFQQNIESAGHSDSSSSSSPSSISSSLPQYIPIAPKPQMIYLYSNDVTSHSTQQVRYPSTSESASLSTVDDSAPRKRRRLEFSSREEEYIVKRQLNNEASARSRAKRRQLVEATKVECANLESRNRELKDMVAEYESQISTLKDILYSKLKK